jgi:2-oxoacid:acceptor oxidoreductase delta subunit (pyruvate/2-ketoisovalerate family)
MDMDTAGVEEAIEAELKKPAKNVDSAMEAFEKVCEPELLPGSPVARPAPAAPFKTMEELPELAHSLTDAQANRTGSWRSQRPVHLFRMAPCNARCPAGNDVRGFLEALADKDPTRALEILLETSPFPGVCGRVCPHPCEDECNRADIDGAVAVMASERYAEAHGDEIEIEVDPPNGKSVGIVGAGPAGLSAAWQLGRKGYEVVVYEAAPHPGGMLLLGIPSFRLPREVLHREISRIAKVGVEIRCDTAIGKDVAFDELRERHDAVMVAVGQQLDWELGIPGEEMPGSEHGLAFLRRHNLGGEVDVRDKVVVIGGGNTAIDVAGVCMRKSRTRDVTIVYRRTRAEMPAITEEIDHVLDEGVKLVERIAPVEVRSGPDGRVSGLVCDRMELREADGSGRPRPVPIEGSRHTIECDQVFFATGQDSDLSFASGFKVNADGVTTGDTEIFAAGDAATADGTVTAAIGSGRRAALAVRAALEGIELGPERSRKITWAPLADEVLRFDRINPSYFGHRERGEPPRLSVSQRLYHSREVVGEIDDGCAEAGRCLSCGTCTGCDNCFVFCPEPAVRRSDGVYAFDLDYCKGCGVCLEECPRGAIDMVEEG